MNGTDVTDLLGELDAGIFEAKMREAFAQVALAVAIHGKKGRVLLTFDFARIGESAQVELTHRLTYTKPTERGTVREDNATSTPLHVGVGGTLTVLAQTGDLFKQTQERE